MLARHHSAKASNPRIVPDACPTAQLCDLGAVPRDAVAAATFLYEQAHQSSAVAAQTKTQMLVEGAVPALCHHLLSSKSAELRRNACLLLGEMAFRNPHICRAITSHERVVPKLLRMMDSNGTCDANLVLNNCAAFSEHSCKSMVECPGLLQKFKKQAACTNSDARGIAVGVLNCLSRCPAVAPALVDARVVEEALAPALCSSGAGDRHEAMLARAAMAMANLKGSIAVVDEESAHGGGCRTNVAVATTVKILGFALDGRSWGGIHFASYR